MADYVDELSDAELRTKLAEFGFPLVPITSTTRKVMVKKLKLLIENRNKINSEGRRSLAKYSSEEESDTDTKVKKDKNRRATIMLPPMTKTRKSVRKSEVLESPQTVTETKTTITKISKVVPEAEFETGSDSEPDVEIIEKISPKKIIPVERPKQTYVSPSSSRMTIGSPETYSPRYTVPQDSSDSAERLNQIRSRLRLSANHAPTFKTTNFGDGDAPIETPFLSNFTKRLSQISNVSKTEFRNDIVKEHDANGSSFSRSYLNRARRDYPHEFRSSQEKNIFKNSLVSFTLLGIACAFFIVITVMYMGIRTEQSAVTDTSDYVIPVCTEDPSMKPGVNCVSQSESTDALNLLKVVVPELTKRVFQYNCGGSGAMPFMTDEHIIDHVIAYYAIQERYEVQKAINALQVLIFRNPKWGISIIQTDSFPTSTIRLESMDQVLSNRHNKNLAMTLLSPELPWKCIIYNKLYTILSSVFIIAIGFSVVFFGQRGYKYILKQRKLKNDQVYTMVGRIIDILQTNASDNNENFLAVNHVRDMLIPPQDRRSMSSIWNSAVKFLQENESRVRTEVQIVSGEEFHVWRWLGSNLGGSSPRSKTWQGQAFETQVGSVNSLPCSPTPCLKIRGMFDERERNLYTIREAVLSKCTSKCQILHCEVDQNANCVYLKCANQHEAAIAYRNLHGWWYDGHLVTVKYLRLERYMQRFPDSPAKGPPFLHSTSNQSLGTDWTSNDD